MEAVKFVVCFVMVALVHGKLVHEMKIPGKDIPFKWENCKTTSPSMIDLKVLKVVPQPLKYGKQVEIDVSLDVKKTIGANPNKPVNIDVTADMEIPNQTIPFDVCSYGPQYCHIKDVCTLIKQKKFECPKMLQDLGIKCQCPLIKGTITPPKITLPIPDPPVKISGHFNVTIKISEGESNIGCLSFQFCIESCEG